MSGNLSRSAAVRAPDANPAFTSLTSVIEAGEPGQIPLVIGVTGHRDLIPGDRGKLEQAVREVLFALRGDCPDTPLVVISALAEGADRLVTKIACDEYGAKLVAPLPLPPPIYEEDFPTEESRREFRELLAGAARRFVVPMVDGNTEVNVNEPERRNCQYEAAGKYIVRYCRVLIALWDGCEKGDVGGTWQVVRLQLEGDRSSRSGLGPLDTPKRGSVYHVVTPRRRATPVTGTPYTWSLRFPPPIPPGDAAKDPATEKQEEEKRRGVYKAILSRIGKFNHDVADLLPRLRQEAAPPSRQAAEPDWVTPKDRGGLPPSSLASLKHFEATDELSIYYAGKTRDTFFWLFGLAFFAICIFEFWAHLLRPAIPRLELGPWPQAILRGTILIYLAIWLVAYVVWWWAHRQDCQDKFQDYRALAEALRVQFAWDLAGLDNAVEDSYLRKQRGELEWIRYALRTWKWQQGDPAGAPGQQVPLKHLQLIRRVWIGGQRDWFRPKHRDQHSNAECFPRWGRRVFLLSLAVALILAVCEIHGDGEFADYFLAAIGILTVTAATAIAWGEKMAYAEHANQYRTMHTLFAIAAWRFDRPGATDAERVQILRELGKEALAENGDWLLMHRERRLELPIP